MEKVAIFIDGGYLNRVLKEYFNEVDLDYNKLSLTICKRINAERLRTYFYHCMPIIRGGNKKDEDKHAGMQKFITKLKRLPRYEVKLGRLQFIGGQFKQKMVDVLMSLDITKMSYDKQIQHVALIAGDSDFVPAIKTAKNNGAIVHLFYHPFTVHNELLDEIDELHPITKELIKECENLKNKTENE